MSDDLYPEEILTRARAGASDSRLQAPDRRAARDNPLCGDRITLDLTFTDGRVAALGHRTRGCALCQAAAETLRRCVPGTDRSIARVASAAVRAFLASGTMLPEAFRAFDVFAPAQAHRARHSCILLPLDALDEALADGE